MLQPGLNAHLWRFQFEPLKLNAEEQKLFESYAKTTDWEERTRINGQLRQSLEKRGQRYAGIDRRENKLNPIPAGPGVYKVTLTVNGVSMTKPSL